MSKNNVILKAVIIGLLTISAHAETSEPLAKRVTVKPVSAFLFRPAYSIAAQTVALNAGTVSAQLAAPVAEIPVRVGDRVAKNQVLVTLDCRDARLSYTSAQARLTLSRKELARAQALKASKAITEQLLNQTENELNQAQVAVRQAALQVERCEIKAPYAAIVMERQTAVGAQVAPGSPVIRLTGTTDLEVSATLPPQTAAQLQTVDDWVFRFQQNDYPLHLRTLIPVVEPTTGQQNARFDFAQTPSLPGSTGRIVGHAAQLYLPADLLQEHQGQIGIFVVHENTARFLALPDAQIGRPARAPALGPNIRVVLDGRYRITEGDLVEVVTP